jgi:hypothetical protein
MGRSTGPVNVVFAGVWKSQWSWYWWITASGPTTFGGSTPMRICGGTFVKPPGPEAVPGGRFGPSRSAGRSPSKPPLCSETNSAVTGAPASMAARSNAVTVMVKPPSPPNSRAVIVYASGQMPNFG